MDHIVNKQLISRCCWQALVLVALMLLIFPDTFANSYWLGKTWLWLLAAPVCILLVVHRYRFAVAWQAGLVNSPSRRRGQSFPVSGRRRGFGKSSAQRNPLRAA